MSQSVPNLRRTVVVLLSLCAIPLLGGCETLTGVNRPDELRVVFDSNDVEFVTMVLSPHFLLVPNPECPDTCERLPQLVVSDTTSHAVPFDQTFAFTSREQYFVEIFPTVEQVATLSMEVYVDGETLYNDFRELQVIGQDGKRETIRVIYTFNELIL
ncbi:MAG: hypothetical protein HKO53_06610 [Gemmatimonadetes bacterium]|nr:hypothetical protein [Gemmatimonadota bacterium]